MNQNIPSKNIAVNTPHSFFNPKIQEVCIGHAFDDGSMTYVDNRVLWTLIEEVLKNGGLAATLSRTQIMLQNLSITNVCTITRTTQRLERWGLITVTRGQYDKSQRMWTPNTYSVNWETLVREFGHVVDQLKGRLWDFLVKMKERILGFYRDGVSNTASDALCNTLKTPAGSTKEEKTIPKLAIAPLGIAKEKKASKVFASCFAKGSTLKKKFALERKEESGLMITHSEAEEKKVAYPPDSALPPQPSEAEENYMVKRLPRGVAKPFDVRMTVCPPEYVKIAVDVGLHPSWITEQFDQFADYWSLRTKMKIGQKTDWQATWRNWMRDNVNDRKYLRLPNPSDPQLLGNSEQLNCPADTDIVKKIKKHLQPGEFESWLSECPIKNEGDSYVLTVPKRFDRFKKDSIKTKFDIILTDECHIRVIYET